jgi:hypothetical protein
MTGSLEDQDEKLIRSIRGHAFYFIQKPFDKELRRRSWSAVSSFGGIREEKPAACGAVEE